MSDRNGIVRDRIARARARAGHFAVDVGTATRVTGRALNTSTSQLGDTIATIYTGPARLKREMPTDQVAGDAERPALRVVLELPYDEPDSGALRKGDTFTWSASLDAALVGVSVTVLGPEHGSTTSVRRYVVEEVTA